MGKLVRLNKEAVDELVIGCGGYDKVYVAYLKDYFDVWEQSNDEDSLWSLQFKIWKLAVSANITMEEARLFFMNECKRRVAL